MTALFGALLTPTKEAAYRNRGKFFGKFDPVGGDKSPAEPVTRAGYQTKKRRPAATGAGLAFCSISMITRLR